MAPKHSITLSTKAIKVSKLACEFSSDKEIKGSMSYVPMQVAGLNASIMF